MRISSEKKIENSGVKKTARGSEPGGLFRIAESGKTAKIIATPAAQSVNSVGVLLAAQEKDSAKQRQSAIVRRGRNMLNLLDQLKLGYLNGQVSQHTISALGTLSRQPNDAALDPSLVSVMQSIELRAEVELAKLARQKN